MYYYMFYIVNLTEFNIHKLQHLSKHISIRVIQDTAINQYYEHKLTDFAEYYKELKAH